MESEEDRIVYDPLQDIHFYGKNLTISQVVKFFIKKEINITRAMIQNYIRDGLLPPPVNKRYYTHKHLAALVIIDYLKNVFDMSDIKRALQPHIDEEGIPLEIYQALAKTLENVSAHWNKQMLKLFAEEDVLLLMAHTVDLKGLSQSMLKDEMV